MDTPTLDERALACFKAGAHTRETLSAALNIPPGSFTQVFGVGFSEYVEKLVSGLAPHDLLSAGAARANQALRRHQVLAGAIHLSKGEGRNYARFTREQVARLTGMSPSNVARLHSMPELRAAVVAYAIKYEDRELLAQAKTFRDPLVV